MRKLISFATLVFALLVSVSPIQAQTATTQTILSAAVTSNATTMTVASITGMTAGTTALYLDGEYVGIRTVPSTGTTIGVNRGQSGTRAVAHTAGEVVWVGPTGQPSPFQTLDGFPGMPAPGSCTSTSITYLPVINVVNGNIWDCQTLTTAAGASVTNGTTVSSGQIWQAVNFVNLGYSFPYRTVVNAAYTAKLYDVVIDYTSVSAARTVTLPGATGQFGKIYIIKNSGALSSGASLTVASSVGQYILTIGTTTDTVPWGGVARYIFQGAGWTTW